MVLSAYSLPFPHGSQHRALCPRRRLGLIDCTWIVSHFRQFVKREFSRPLRLTVSTHGHAFLRCVSGLRLCASVFGFPLPVFPSCFRFRRSWPCPSMSPWRISDKLSCVDCMRWPCAVVDILPHLVANVNTFFDFSEKYTLSHFCYLFTWSALCPKMGERDTGMA